MKQHIEPSQLNELSEEAKKRLRKWWKPQDGDCFYGKNYDHELTELFVGGLDGPSYDYTYASPDDEDLPLLSIGQMIEFLDDDTAETCSMPIMIPASDYEGSWWRVIVNDKSYYWTELCDALWSAVKEVLETGG